MESINETQPEIIETHTEQEPLLKETKKVKKERTQKQLDAFEKARKTRLENINKRKMDEKVREVADYKNQKVVKEVIEEELTHNNPTPAIINREEESDEEEIKPKLKKEKIKKRKPKTPPPSDSDDSSSSEEEEYIIRKRKPVRNRRKTKVEKEQLEEAVEEKYFQNIIFV